MPTNRYIHSVEVHCIHSVRKPWVPVNLADPADADLAEPGVCRLPDVNPNLLQPGAFQMPGANPNPLQPDPADSV